MKKKLELDFGILKIYDNILVSELKEGILFDIESNRKLLEIGAMEFKGRAYGYISNRIFSYAVDPMVYREAADFINLKAIAVVTSDPICRSSAMIEKKFFRSKNSFEIFEAFDDARAWINKELFPIQRKDPDQ
ncbi:MAG TPA: hypothetical protein VFM60_02495 [Salinimicrobium sp.]|nr:hypothetical protein [Salinimicrobium sp.]